MQKKTTIPPPKLQQLPARQIGVRGRVTRNRSPCADRLSSGLPPFISAAADLDGLDDADVRPAAAQVAFHALDDLLPGGLGIAIQEAVGAEDHARRAESALEGIVLDEGLLKRMQVAVLGQSFDGDDLSSIGVSHRIETRSHGPVVHQDRAGPALGLAAAELGARQTQVGAQDPQERAPSVRGHADRFAIEFEGDCLCHVEPSLDVEPICRSNDLRQIQ